MRVVPVRRRRLLVWAGLLALAVAGAPRIARENLLSGGGRLEEAWPLPEFPGTESAWVGTEPLTVEDLRGRVWVIKVWTFGCVNCVRSIPYANGLTERFGDEVGVLGVHAPEFDWERDPEGLAEAIREHGVRFPSYVDGSLDYFFALGATAWPAFFVVDRRGLVRGVWEGEVHEGTLRARGMERLIGELVEE